MKKEPQNLLFSKTHEWVRNNGNNLFTVGVTQHAQHLLGELVFIELPILHRQVAEGDEVAVLESVKTAADVYSPVQGEIVAINEELQKDPAQLNQDPYGKGWLFKVKGNASLCLENLIDSAAYNKIVAAEEQ